MFYGTCSLIFIHYPIAQFKFRISSFDVEFQLVLDIKNLMRLFFLVIYEKVIIKKKLSSFSAIYQCINHNYIYQCQIELAVIITICVTLFHCSNRHPKMCQCMRKLSRALNCNAIIEWSWRYHAVPRVFNQTLQPLCRYSRLLWGTMSRIQIIILMNALWTLKIMVNVSSAYYFLSPAG